MSSSIANPRRFVCVILSLALTIGVVAQQPQQPAQPEVVRGTELMQTGVVVLDKQGRFVEGLKPEQFQLKVDGKLVTPAFFEHVVAGSAREEKLETAGVTGNTSTGA